MRTLTILIESETERTLERAGAQFVKAWKSGRYGGEHLSFETLAALFRVLTPARWSVLEALQKSGHCGLRELAAFWAAMPAPCIETLLRLRKEDSSRRTSPENSLRLSAAFVPK